MLANLNDCTWFILRHCRDPPTGGSVCKMSGIKCVTNSETIQSGWDGDGNDLHTSQQWEPESAQPAGETSPRPSSHSAVFDSLPSFLTPCENITSSDLSTSPVMSQRLQQSSMFQCMDAQIQISWYRLSVWPQNASSGGKYLKSSLQNFFLPKQVSS